MSWFLLLTIFIHLTLKNKIMSYTIVGMFPTATNADQASSKLDSAGFSKENYSVSRYTTDGEYDPNTNHSFQEDEKTSGFWDWLFGENEEERGKYSYAGTRSNIVTVYTDDLDSAQKAREILNNQGAINVNDFTKDKFPANEATHNSGLPEDQYARIIAKAKNDVYLTDENRVYTVKREGMESDMDSQGFRDTF